MPPYHIAHEIDLRCYPNYSFEVGDVDGDGRMELVYLTQNGNRLRVIGLDGKVRLDRHIANFGNWGTVVPCVLDVNGDGRAEVIVPHVDVSRGQMARIVAMDAEGAIVAEHCFGTYERDAFGVTVPLLAPLRLGSRLGGQVGVIAAVAGGRIVALDTRLQEMWRVDGLRHDFAHEFCVADIDQDGLDEVAFCTVDHIDGRGPANAGDLVVLDHDGRMLLRENVGRYYPDTHFDCIAMADFRGAGEVEILLEKGILINLNGDVVWDVSKQLDHGQWIAHTEDPQRGGQLILMSELWAAESKGCLLTGAGELVATTAGLPRSRLDQASFPGWKVLATRGHAVQWTPEAAPEFFLAEQACAPTSHDCFATRSFQLRAFFLDAQGELLAALPFEDAQIESYWYNGEVRSRVADVDGDGRPEIIFPRQNGRVMVIKKEG